MADRLTEPTLDAATLEALIEAVGGDRSFLAELIDAYLSDAADMVAGLEAAAASASVEDLVRPAHTLKSNSANLGALRLAALCRSLEADARAGAVADPTSRVAAVSEELERVRPALLAARDGG